MDDYRESYAGNDIKYYVINIGGPIAIRAREVKRQGCEVRGI